MLEEAEDLVPAAHPTCIRAPSLFSVQLLSSWTPRQSLVWPSVDRSGSHMLELYLLVTTGKRNSERWHLMTICPLYWSSHQTRTEFEFISASLASVHVCVSLPDTIALQEKVYFKFFLSSQINKTFFSDVPPNVMDLDMTAWLHASLCRLFLQHNPTQRN